MSRPGLRASEPRALSVSRLPIRLKLTLAFALLIAAVIGTTGFLIYLRFASELDRTITQGLRSRAGDVTALIRQADTGLAQSGRSPLTEQGQSFAQILDGGGRIVDATPQIRARPLLTASELRRAAGGTTLIEKGAVPGLDEASRLLATPVRAQDQRLVVVVGASLEDREDALANLAALLLVGAPIAVLLASGVGYGVIAAALRPVERMRRRAADISAAEPGQRLPVPPADDEISRLGETLNAMLDRLAAAFARERTFVSDASHELRTPLAILRTELELATRKGRSPDELLAALRSAAEETDRLSQLAEDLLVIARSDQGWLPVRLGAVSAVEVLDGIRSRFARRAGEHAATLRVEAPEDLTVLADPLRLEQAVGNMLDNALRHGDGDVTLCAGRRGGKVEIHVLDRGPGLPPGLTETAFERFTRGDAARTRGGAGLGLAIVAAIARAHGGRGAAEREGGGADVWIALPDAERAA